jgi:hypothetical protein
MAKFRTMHPGADEHFRALHAESAGDRVLVKIPEIRQ